MKKQRKRSNRSVRASKKPSQGLVIVAIVLFMATIFLFFRMFYAIQGSYHGLESRADYPLTTLQESNYSWNNGLRYYSDENYTSKVGIDVSEHQGTIDWQKVKASGVQFAMLRVGFRGHKNGTIVEDAKFREYLEGAKAAGLEVGVYFFSDAVNTDEAVEEAKFVIEKIRRHGVTYPVAFDLEFDEGSRHEGLTAEERTEITTAFCQVIQQNGYKAVVYGNPTYFSQSVDLSRLSNYELWLAHYVGETGFPYQFTMWQYSNTGKLPGVSTACDMNILLIKK